MADIVNERRFRAEVGDGGAQQTRRALQLTNDRILEVARAFNPLGETTSGTGLAVTGYATLTDVDGNSVYVAITDPSGGGGGAVSQGTFYDPVSLSDNDGWILGDPLAGYTFLDVAQESARWPQDGTNTTQYMTANTETVGITFKFTMTGQTGSAIRIWAWGTGLGKDMLHFYLYPETDGLWTGLHGYASLDITQYAWCAVQQPGVWESGDLDSVLLAVYPYAEGAANPTGVRVAGLVLEVYE